MTALDTEKELVDPGVVPIHQRRPDATPFGPATEVDAWGGLARRPTPPIT